MDVCELTYSLCHPWRFWATDYTKHSIMHKHRHHPCSTQGSSSFLLCFCLDAELFNMVKWTKSIGQFYAQNYLLCRFCVCVSLVFFCCWLNYLLHNDLYLNGLHYVIWRNDCSQMYQGDKMCSHNSMHKIIVPFFRRILNFKFSCFNLQGSTICLEKADWLYLVNKHVFILMENT